VKQEVRKFGMGEGSLVGYGRNQDNDTGPPGESFFFFVCRVEGTSKDWISFPEERWIG
jgi:hypothetical protein